MRLSVSLFVVLGFLLPGKLAKADSLPDLALLAQGSLVQNVLEGLSPPVIDLPSGTGITVTDIIYCGSNASAGLALLLLGSDPSEKLSLLKMADCKRSPGDILKDYAPASKTIGVGSRRSRQNRSL